MKRSSIIFCLISSIDFRFGIYIQYRFLIWVYMPIEGHFMPIWFYTSRASMVIIYLKQSFYTNLKIRISSYRSNKECVFSCRPAKK